MDGPVVTAARKALDEKNVNLILPYVPKEGEAEVIRAYDKVIQLRNDGAVGREIADLYFFETVVRIHRAGEGAPYTGLKPAGLGEGPVIPIAEKAIETGSPDELVSLLCNVVQEEVLHKFHHMLQMKEYASKSVDDAREYVEAMLGLQVWSHKLYGCATSAAHDGHHEHG
jgi:hypothetical protein